MQTLYLIRGVPGAGKSTLANELEYCGLVAYVHEADQFFDGFYGYEFDVAKLKQAHEFCMRKVKHSLGSGLSVAVSNTSTTEKEVETYQQIAKEYGVRFVSLIVENRAGTNNIHNVPEEKIQQMKNRFSVKL